MSHNNKNNLIIQDNIKSVEIHYNGNEKQFDEFLKSVIKNYIFNNTIESGDNYDQFDYSLDIENLL